MNDMKFRGYAGEAADLFDKHLDRVIPDDHGSGMGSYIKQLVSGGKRIRPILTTLSYQAVGGNMEDAVPLAMAMEFTHNATLIHDDIIDKDTIRRKIPALHEKLGRGAAIIIGDALISLAVALSTNYGTEVTRLIANYGFDVCNGELMDISNSLEKASEDFYFLKVKKKSASLFKASTHVGALAGGGSKEEVSALAEFGENLGVAYQLRDDILDLSAVKKGKIPSDLRNGVLTLPLIHLHENSGDETRKFLRENFGGGIEISAAERIMNAMEDAKSIDYCEKKIDERVNAARENISGLRDSEFKEYLLELPGFVLNYLDKHCS